MSKNSIIGLGIAVIALACLSTYIHEIKIDSKNNALTFEQKVEFTDGFYKGYRGVVRAEAPQGKYLVHVYPKDYDFNIAMKRNAVTGEPMRLGSIAIDFVSPDNMKLLE